MIFKTKELTKLYKETAQILEEDESTKNLIERMSRTIEQSGNTLTSQDLNTLYTYLNGRFPYLGYVTGELIKLSCGKIEVSLTDEEIKLYATLALHYKLNEQRFEIK